MSGKECALVAKFSRGEKLAFAECVVYTHPLTASRISGFDIPPHSLGAVVAQTLLPVGAFVVAPLFSSTRTARIANTGQ
jgi:hypothetical protein